MSHNILIVDDSATTRAMIKRTITLCGVATASILEAEDGQKALDVLAQNPVDLVLADLHMPVMTGVEMTRRMLVDPTLRKIPVVIVSADPNGARIDDLRKQGARGYLAKPFTPEGLRDVISQVLPLAA